MVLYLENLKNIYKKKETTKPDLNTQLSLIQDGSRVSASYTHLLSGSNMNYN